MSPQQTILVTGAFGNVGRYTVQRLVEHGYRVVATDVRSDKSEKSARATPDLDVRWLDLRDASAVAALVADVRPDAVLHLAAVIPPIAYAHPALAEAVNVGGTANVVAAVQQLERCRLVFASSIAVYGARNPHREEVLTAATPSNPRDVYGAHKVAAEAIVTGSSLDWVILRLGGVMFPEMSVTADDDIVYLEGLLPSDGRIETVDVRDVAAAFVSAIAAKCVGKVLLIGGGPGNQLTQEQVGRGITSAMGLRNALSQGRPGDPGDDDAWFVTDWMDTAEAEALLRFQYRSFDDTMADLRASIGPLRPVLTVASPLVKVFLWWRSPMRGSQATYAPLWPSVEKRWGAGALSPVEPERRP
ncbi:MAG TPA: NAD(P)-dependent oxidoreductase [Nocardioidaceae bacterium]|nr:NAD(P)-dependent oxidoreductase [Nocardioidaceae bacterium]